MTIEQLIEALRSELRTGTPPGTLVVIEQRDGTMEPVDQLVSLAIGDLERVAIL